MCENFTSEKKKRSLILELASCAVPEGSFFFFFKILSKMIVVPGMRIIVEIISTKRYNFFDLHVKFFVHIDHALVTWIKQGATFAHMRSHVTPAHDH